MQFRLIVSLCFLLVSNCLFGGNRNYQYQPIVFDFISVEAFETDSENPFLDYRLQATFTNGDNEFIVPGFFAADGDAANSSATGGKVWRVVFTPPIDGQWSYNISFKKGKNIALGEDAYEGTSAGNPDGESGEFTVNPVPENAEGFFKTGSLKYNNSHHFFTQNGQPIVLFGSNSPENFLACIDIDGTYNSVPGKNYLKTWEPHIMDWKEGDPTWKEIKGKGIIGALNYLAAQGMNVLYLMTLNLDGDASDVWPFISHKRKDFLRYDISKLAQWDVVFSHAEKLGIAIELVTQEQENQLLLDNGYLETERKLYYRELIARFGYHNNLIWNIGEENGEHDHYWPQGQNNQMRYAMIKYLHDHDPYKHPVMMHTFAVATERDPIAKRLLKMNEFAGLSMQIYDKNDVHSDIRHWINESEKFGHPWTIMMDEIGPWHTGTKTDEEDPAHNQMRKEVLWGAITAGAAGVQWYFGWTNPPNDLNAEDFRSREKIWKQSLIAKKIMEQVDYTKMHCSDELVSLGNNYCFSEEGKTYLIYLKDGGTTQLNLSQHSGNFSIEWYDPRNGGMKQNGTEAFVQGGKWIELGKAPNARNQDWIIIVRKT